MLLKSADIGISADACIQERTNLVVTDNKLNDAAICGRVNTTYKTC